MYLLLSVLLYVPPGCSQPGTIPAADHEPRADTLRLMLTPLRTLLPATDLQRRLEVTVQDRRSGAYIASSIPEVTSAQMLPGRTLAFITPDQRLWVWRPGGSQRVLDRAVVGPVSSSPGGRLLAYTQQPTAGGALWLVEINSGQRWRLSAGGAASLPLFSPDGERIAYVDTSPQGIASLFVVTLSGRKASTPRQLTNLGLQRRSGRAPAGFIPPPAPGALRWEAGVLRYRAAGQSWAVPAVARPR